MLNSIENIELPPPRKVPRKVAQSMDLTKGIKKLTTLKDVVVTPKLRQSVGIFKTPLKD